jgi:hypothetical protein
MTTSVTLTGAVVVIVVLVAMCLGFLRLVRRVLKVEELESHNVITDPMSQLVGMMFAILLGFMVGDAMNRFATARSIVQQEAASVADVFRLAAGFDAADRDRIRGLCTRYVDEVANDEWPKMAHKKTSNKVWKTYNELWDTLATLKAKDDSQAAVLQCILPCMVSASDNRRMRVESMHNGLPAVLWVVLGIAAVASILFTFLFGVRNRGLQMMMTSIVAIVIGLNIFLLASYNDPFSGDVMVHADSFVVDKKIFQTVLDTTDPFETE